MIAYIIGMVIILMRIIITVPCDATCEFLPSLVTSTPVEIAGGNVDINKVTLFTRGFIGRNTKARNAAAGHRKFFIAQVISRSLLCRTFCILLPPILIPREIIARGIVILPICSIGLMII